MSCHTCGGSPAGPRIGQRPPTGRDRIVSSARGITARQHSTGCGSVNVQQGGGGDSSAVGIVDCEPLSASVAPGGTLQIDLTVENTSASTGFDYSIRVTVGGVQSLFNVHIDPNRSIIYTLPCQVPTQTGSQPIDVTLDSFTQTA